MWAFTFQPTADHAPVNIRTTMIDGEPWFVAADVCRALHFYIDAKGYPNAAMAIAKLRSDERRVIDPALNPIEGAKKGLRQLHVVSEPGLYALIGRSDKPEAKDFQRWVNHEVLPAIRKTGSYSLADHGREAMPLPMDIAEALAVALKPMAEKLDTLSALVQALMPKPDEDRMFTAAAAIKTGNHSNALNPCRIRLWN